MIRAVDDAGTFDWGCTRCGTEQRGWVIDPAKGQLSVADGCFAVVCPCGSVTNYHRGLRPFRTAHASPSHGVHILAQGVLYVFYVFLYFS